MKRIVLLVLVLLVAGAGYGVWRSWEPDIPRAALEAKYAKAPSQFLTLADGTRVHYRDRGPKDTPVILLLHGSNSSLFDFEAWSNTLSNMTNTIPDATIGRQSGPKPRYHYEIRITGIEGKRPKEKITPDQLQRMWSVFGVFRVITVDLPGHGLTGAVPSGDYSQGAMAAFVKAFADKLGLTKFAIAGNSMGGGVAARFAEMYPGRVSHLILIDADADGITATGNGVPLAFRLARIPVVNQLLLHITPRDFIVEGLDDAVVHKAIVTDAMIDTYWDFARMQGSRAATIARFNLAPDYYVRDHVRAITAPTLILWGEEDHILPVAGAHAWAKAIPGAKLIVYPATGHLPMEEVPQESAADVRNFITRPH